MSYIKFNFLLLSLLIFDVAKCQLMDSAIIKTRPFQDFIGFNPNFSIEKCINKKITIEVELMYRNKSWYSNGGEWNFGRFHQSDGFRLLGGARKYIGKRKASPFAWFLGIQLAYSYIKFNEMDEYSFKNSYQNTVNIDFFWSELRLNFGRQFCLYKNITFEFYLSPTKCLSYYKKTEIIRSIDPDEIGIVKKQRDYPMIYDGFAFSWTLGYQF